MELRAEGIDWWTQASSENASSPVGEAAVRDRRTEEREAGDRGRRHRRQEARGRHLEPEAGAEHAAREGQREAVVAREQHGGRREQRPSEQHERAVQPVEQRRAREAAARARKRAQVRARR